MKTKKLKAGIFVDGANIFYAQKKVGWRIDWEKLKKLLSKETNISFVHYHLAVPAKWDQAYKTTQNYIKNIKTSADIFVKPLKYIRSGNTVIKKGDVDLELALDIIRNLEKLDLVIIVSGDSDYLVLRNFILEKKKKIIFLCFKENAAWELKKGKYLLFNQLQKYIELSHKKTPGFYPGRLLLDILYHKK